MHPAIQKPETGGRLSAWLLEHGPRGARYQVGLATPEGCWFGSAEINRADGSVAWTTEGNLGADLGSAPEWLLHYAHAALRGAWRQSESSGWPQRLTRWRDVPARRPLGSDSDSDED